VKGQPSNVSLVNTRVGYKEHGIAKVDFIHERLPHIIGRCLVPGHGNIGNRLLFSSLGDVQASIVYLGTPTTYWLHAVTFFMLDEGKINQSEILAEGAFRSVCRQTYCNNKYGEHSGLLKVHEPRQN
jgi:hypothetical protein